MAENAFQKQSAPPAGSKTKLKKPLSDKDLEEYKSEADNRGIVYMSHVPPMMKANKVRALLTKQGAEILRIYLAPEDSIKAIRRKENGGKRGKRFTEGWIEFADRKQAKHLAGLLNGQNIGGKRFSKHHYDLWNLKFLKKFKWEHLTEELAYQKAVREQKLAVELRGAKRERDFYLARVDQAHAVDAMEERNAKKRAGAGEGTEVDETSTKKKRKMLRNFQQRDAIPDPSAPDADTLDMDVLANVFSRGE
eukprot:CAMPEP_0114231834 /NCGR_PEP_ID=MMETSP0058-20121206/4271_1 /TAXON_ID=36894 /ORGANISM="Pyramimonas parkeae, CCMP726" /LENGTH=249 /DNA_ID=CAMNT_0001343241 /DNA_START=291 /DNA_END=1040 /DNA_ORIENTATION=-